jgi:hypothetical protein
MMMVSNVDEELKLVSKRIKRADSTADAAAILRSLHQFAEKTRDSSRLPYARVLYLKGVISSKAAVRNLLVRHSSSSELLEAAIRDFTTAETLAKQLLESALAAHERTDITRIRQDCAYEAAVCCTVLLSKGQKPSLIPDTNTLSESDKRKVSAAFRNHYALRSRAY